MTKTPKFGMPRAARLQDGDTWGSVWSSNTSRHPASTRTHIVVWNILRLFPFSRPPELSHPPFDSERLCTRVVVLMLEP